MLNAMLLALALVAAFLTGSNDVYAAAAAQASPSPPACRTWQDCRQLALDAAERSDYQQFHDLAWRAVQAGPAKDPALMYLLARAQCLSGRPHDALVMLRRLADAGVATDADTNDDFRLTRELPGWPEVAALLAGIRTGTPAPTAAAAGGAGRTARTERPVTPPPPSARASAAATPAPPAAGNVVAAPKSVAAPPPPAPAPPPSAATPPAPAVAASRAAASVPIIAKMPALKPAKVNDAARFSAGGFIAGGLAYDAVSKRFVVGDASGRKLMVVSESSDHATDMVRADSAGFQDVLAVEIDERRGDLWVASAATAGGESALHRLQLVSGRPLRTYRPAAAAAQLLDLAVTASGSVLALDGAGNQLLLLKRGETALEPALPLKHEGAVSLTMGADEAVGYVASPEGIWRVDLKAKTTTAMTAPAGLDLGHFERIRLYRNTLIGVEAPVDGTRRVVRLDLNNTGRAITAASVIDTSIPDTRGATFATVSGDDLYYLAVDAPATSSPAPAAAATGALADFVVRRVSLR
jgi:hypothetical protein